VRENAKHKTAGLRATGRSHLSAAIRSATVRAELTDFDFHGGGTDAKGSATR
jgi:hypothetical protein